MVRLELEPEARVVLLEAERCGGGPSGRNGGFVNAMWFSLPTLRQRFGDAAALRLTRAAEDAVPEIGRWCEEQRVDAWYRSGGYLQVSTAAAHDDSWREVVDACSELGVPGVCRPLSEDEGAGPLRFADLPGRGLLPRGHGAPGAVGARASRPPPGTRGEHLRGLAGQAAGGERRASRRAPIVAVCAPPGGSGHWPGARRPPPAAPAADRHLQPCGDHRAGARRARRARLDGRRVHHRLATPDPLLPHHARRTHRPSAGEAAGWRLAAA